MNCPLKTACTVVCIAATFLSAACRHEANNKPDSPAIVGTWVVKIPEAPFPLHMFVFHSDGTVQQSNPDAGNAKTSDSSAMGIWQAEGDSVKGKIVEINADRTTHQFASRAEISFSIKVKGDAFRGVATANFSDSEGRPTAGPTVH